MKNLQPIFDQIEQLSPAELRRVLNYILEKQSGLADNADQSLQSPRILGLHAHLGEAWMSDDFGDELPDMFWLGET